MAVRYFVAIIEKAEDGLSVFFPDLPGCTSAGPTLEQAVANAEEALALHLDGMAADREAIPNPTPLDQVECDPEAEEHARLLVRAEMPGRIVRFNVTMDEGLLAAADAAAQRRSQTRAGFLADAVRAVLRKGVAE